MKKAILIISLMALLVPFTAAMAIEDDSGETGPFLSGVWFQNETNSHYTGWGVTNPSNVTVQVTVGIFSTNGTLCGCYKFSIPANGMWTFDMIYLDGNGYLSDSPQACVDAVTGQIKIVAYKSYSSSNKRVDFGNASIAAWGGFFDGGSNPPTGALPGQPNFASAVGLKAVTLNTNTKADAVSVVQRCDIFVAVTD